jgi:hypothetical protein
MMLCFKNLTEYWLELNKVQRCVTGDSDYTARMSKECCFNAGLPRFLLIILAV